jgi:GH24 family phage-related lysozyme (muramidase)
MVNIKNLIPKKDYKKIAKEFRSMKRIWLGKGLDGLLDRRESEAKLIESC